MNNEEINTAINNIKEALQYPELFENISTSERWLSGITGSYLLFKGLTNLFDHPIIALAGASAGAGLLYRGISGYCPLKDLQAQRENRIPDEILMTQETYFADDLG
ncbi:DUF2892 domain-containing protein [Pedobacter changchengzhani]|uniref:DUF2892 domain-containing protein n=1 Tax=Pedobacter changchengzhani TaxID=2529274 RepID=A0A4V3A0I9_9SPHI|nr:YgaP-like transmembrane domain [Pedobacter changchengzhani]TDG37783.1 DUF2892 domain-containing protein [Pedobacter changchengzhani]